MVPHQKGVRFKPCLAFTDIKQSHLRKLPDLFILFFCTISRNSGKGLRETTSSREPSHPADTQADIISVEADVQHFLAAGVADSTMRTYTAGWARYQKFTTQFRIPPQPITVEKVTLFIAHVGAQGLLTTTIEVYLAGLRFFCLLADPSCAAPSFHTPYTNLLIRGIKRVNMGKGPQGTVAHHYSHDA